MKKTKALFIISIFISIVLSGAAAGILYFGFRYNKIINSTDFIGIASLSVNEAYRLIELTEFYMNRGRILLMAAGVMLIITVILAVIRKKRIH